MSPLPTHLVLLALLCGSCLPPDRVDGGSPGSDDGGQAVGTDAGQEPRDSGSIADAGSLDSGAELVDGGQTCLSSDFLPILTGQFSNPPWVKLHRSESDLTFLVFSVGEADIKPLGQDGGHIVHEAGNASGADLLSLSAESDAIAYVGRLPDTVEDVLPRLEGGYLSVVGNALGPTTLGTIGVADEGTTTLAWLNEEAEFVYALQGRPWGVQGPEANRPSILRDVLGRSLVVGPGGHPASLLLYDVPEPSGVPDTLPQDGGDLFGLQTDPLHHRLYEFSGLPPSAASFLAVPTLHDLQVDGNGESILVSGHCGTSTTECGALTCQDGLGEWLVTSAASSTGFCGNDLRISSTPAGAAVIVAEHPRPPAVSAARLTVTRLDGALSPDLEFGPFDVPDTVGCSGIYLIDAVADESGVTIVGTRSCGDVQGRPFIAHVTESALSLVDLAWTNTAQAQGAGSLLHLERGFETGQRLLALALRSPNGSLPCRPLGTDAAADYFTAIVVSFFPSAIE